ncbi:MAG TPA: hypothetical protein VGO50_19485 [Pyrinomonadaceae bacterium]|nr:hypothetical protein [Pyrinomonadaceae bacterium]
MDWYRRGNKFEWSKDNKTFNDGTEVDSSQWIDLGLKGEFHYQGCVDAECTSTKGAVLLAGGSWDWARGFFYMLHENYTSWPSGPKLTTASLQKDLNIFLEDPLGEKALGNPALSMMTAGFTSKLKGADAVRTGFFKNLFPFKEAAATAVKPEVRQMEQYALRAAKDGLYPIMERGSKEAVGEMFLKTGEVWKFGTTINPASRYSGSFLRNTGSGLNYVTEFKSSLFKDVLQMEKTRITDFRTLNGFLPAGNKMVK